MEISFKLNKFLMFSEDVILNFTSIDVDSFSLYSTSASAKAD